MASEERNVLVLGGTGGIGEGIVAEFLAAGARVIVPSRAQERLDALRARLGPHRGRLETAVLDVGTEEGAEALGRHVDGLGALDAVVAALGRWEHGAPLVRVPLAQWRALLNDTTTAHFLAARTFAPRLAPGGSYTFLNGYAAVSPYPGAGPVSVASAATLMLAQALAQEQTGQARVNTLLLGPVRTRTRGGAGAPQWLRPEDVGRLTVDLAAPAAAHVHAQTIPLMDLAALAQARRALRLERVAPLTEGA